MGQLRTIEQVGQGLAFALKKQVLGQYLRVVVAHLDAAQGVVKHVVEGLFEHDGLPVVAELAAGLGHQAQEVRIQLARERAHGVGARAVVVQHILFVAVGDGPSASHSLAQQLGVNVGPRVGSAVNQGFEG